MTSLDDPSDREGHGDPCVIRKLMCGVLPQLTDALVNTSSYLQTALSF